ncbi:MAG: 2OG-Fe(II) oxygenase [Nannocystaceae bacterium]
MPPVLDLTYPIHWTVEGLLSADECAELIARIEAAGPEAAPITTSRGPVMRPDIRNNDRAILEDAPLAEWLFERVRGHVPAVLGGMEVVGANERLRCYRYDPGQRFAPHYDGAYYRSSDEYSLLTFMVYLNDDFEGGETAFHELGERVIPRAGDALLFQHRVLHEGCAIVRGRKYVVRSDIMYRRRGRGDAR